MKKVLFAVVPIICIAALLFFFLNKKEPIVTEDELKKLALEVTRQRLESSFVPDILIDDLPASAWLLSHMIENCEFRADIRLNYDIALEVSEFTNKEEDLTVFIRNKIYELPCPDVVVSKVYYSFYSMCPYEVAFLYNGEDKSLVEWAKIFKDVAVVAGSPDGRELYGASEDSRIVYRMDEEKVKEIEITFFSSAKGQIESLKKSLLDDLRLFSRKVDAGEWVLRSHWNIPNSWIEEQTNFEDYSRIYLKDYSFSFSVPILKGEVVLWNGYFVEGILYFTYDNWKKVSGIKSWFDIPEVSFTESRDGELMKIEISDKLLKDIFSYIQQLINSSNCDILRKTILERSNDNGQRES